MLTEALSFLRQNPLSQTGSGVFFMALVALPLVSDKKEWRYQFVYPVYLIVFTYVWYPTYAYLWLPVIYGTRVANLIPITVVIALVISYCVSRAHGKEVIVALLAVALLLYYNRDQYTEEYLEDFFQVENIYGIPQDVVDVCDLLLSETEEPLIIVSGDDNIYFRQYSSNIKLLYGNNVLGSTMSTATEIPGDYYDISAILENEDFVSLIAAGETASRYGVDYIVINLSTHVEPYNDGELWYSLYATVGDYAIYKNNSLY